MTRIQPMMAAGQAAMSTNNDPDRVPSLLREFGHFLRHHKAWWLVPLVLVAVLFAVLILVSGKATTPFIYQAH